MTKGHARDLFHQVIESILAAERFECCAVLSHSVHEGAVHLEQDQHLNLLQLAWAAAPAAAARQRQRGPRPGLPAPPPFPGAPLALVQPS